MTNRGRGCIETYSAFAEKKNGSGRTTLLGLEILINSVCGVWAGMYAQSCLRSILLVLQWHSSFWRFIGGLCLWASAYFNGAFSCPSLYKEKAACV